MSFKIGKGSKVIANKIDIHHSVIIKDNVEILCDSIKIGPNSIIADNTKINCKNFEAGDWLYLQKGVEVGRGGKFGPNSNVIIGNKVGVFENTILNPSEEIRIGNNVGIGAEVMIWTHGAWLDIYHGFPSDFGPVSIGDNVWLPARCIVLPNVKIGNNVVIGINSTVNKDLPSGCFAAGSPCRVLRRDCYPKKLSEELLTKKINEIISDWLVLAEEKDIKSVNISYDSLSKIIIFHSMRKWSAETKFHIDEKKIEGNINEYSEDFRDYLRRRGLKFYTDKPFYSIKPKWLK